MAHFDGVADKSNAVWLEKGWGFDAIGLMREPQIGVDVLRQEGEKALESRQVEREIGR
jgi:hypothetical protein